MAKQKTGPERPATTTAQSLGALLKSARDIMRKDKGLNGDLDRLPMLTWIMFLKFLDDLELQREEEAKLAGKKFKPALEPPYRWRDWAASAQGVTGDELLAFINQDECTRPDGQRGPGLFAYLRKLTSANGDDRREVIATVFKGVQNRMGSGYLLRDVINNALRHKLTEIGEKDRVDVILTNPPFGGEEEKGVQGNFPEDKQTAETAMLFLQLIMRMLRRQATAAKRPARAGVVVPNGTLFGDGVSARIKEELLKDFNLHTVVRLPNGVFAPYTIIPTNILFFDRSGPTRDVWYYEHPLPEGRKNYTKTAPLQFEEFAPLMEWWTKREENEQAWKVPAAELLAAGCNLDLTNPRGKKDITHLPPEELAASILKKEQRIAQIMGNIQGLLAKHGA